MEFRLRNRARLRRKEIAQLADDLRPLLGCASLFGEEDPLETAEGPDAQYLILRDEIVGLWHEGRPFLSLRGLLKYGATRRHVTVDMGAVRFVTNGADVMGPGITDADPDLRTGDLLWVREERHGKPLAIGVALADAAALTSKAKGKQVRSLHFVGDKVWMWGQEEPAAKEAPPPTEEPAPDA